MVYSDVRFLREVRLDQIAMEAGTEGTELGPFKQNQLISNVLAAIPSLHSEWSKMEVVFDDIQRLIDNKYIISK
jgi:hypothetical protein